VGLALLVLFVGRPSRVSGASTSLAIDFATADNSSTSVGSIQSCLEVASGADYTVDVDILNVANVAAAQVKLHYQGTVAGRSVINGNNPPTLEPKSILQTAPGAGANAAFIEDVSSDSIPDSRGVHTVVIPNDAATGVDGASGSGILVRFTMTAPIVSSPTFVPITLTPTTLVDAFANEIPHTRQGGSLAVGGALCADAPHVAFITVSTNSSDGSRIQATVTLICTSGSIGPSASQPAGFQTPAVFTVTNFSAGANCTASESVPSEYVQKRNTCTSENLPLTDAGTPNCEIYNLATATVTVNKVYTDSNAAPVTVTLYCDVGGTPNFSITPWASQPAAPFSPAVFTVTGFFAGFGCTASESVPPGYLQASNNCTAANLPLTAGGSPSCTITNTLNSASFTVHKTYTNDAGHAADTLMIKQSQGIEAIRVSANAPGCALPTIERIVLTWPSLCVDAGESIELEVDVVSPGFLGDGVWSAVNPGPSPSPEGAQRVTLPPTPARLPAAGASPTGQESLPLGVAVAGAALVMGGVAVTFVARRRRR
jgi:hypothetical protein